jgi:hypothetical protein
VLVTPSTVYVWQGLGANADELTVATSVASTLAGCYLDTAGREVIQCKEGSEDPEFWNAIGGKQEYVHKPVFMPTCTFSWCFFYSILLFFCLFVLTGTPACLLANQRPATLACSPPPPPRALSKSRR